MPTFNMLSKNYYSHCPLKKRPIKKETSIDPEPENLSTKPRDLTVNHKSIAVDVKSAKDIKPPLADIIYQQKFWPMPSLPVTFFPFQLYSALLPHHEPYEFLNYSPIRLSRDSSLSPPAAAFIEPIKLEKAAKISHGLVPYHQTLLPLSPTSQHLSFNASFTSQSKPPRIMTSAKMLTDFKISTLLKPTKEKEVARKTTSTPPRYQCPDCRKSYSTYSGLVKHQQFHCFKSDEKKVQKTVSCDECGKVYGSTGALKMHIRTHTLPCKCHLCGKAFSRPWLLQGHIRTHTGEKPFSCNHCHRAFADRSNLRAHLQTHSDVKKYSCTTCRKTFSRMSLLTKHNENGCQIVPML